MSQIRTREGWEPNLSKPIITFEIESNIQTVHAVRFGVNETFKFVGNSLDGSVG